VAAGWLSLGTGAARADDCVALGGAIDIGSGECRISSNVSKSGTFNLDETLRIQPTGKITVPAASGGNTLTINVCAQPASCDFIMESGAQIVGNVTGGSAANVS